MRESIVVEPQQLPPPVAAWRPLLIAIGVAAVLVGGAVLLYRDVTGAVEDVVDDVRARRELTIAKEYVKTLLTLQLDLLLNLRQPPVGGRAFVLWPIVTRMIDPDAPGHVEVFFSPADRGALERARARIDEFRALTEERLRSGADFRHMTSYVGHRLDAGERTQDRPGEAQPWIADLHFPGGAIVGFADGVVKWFTREELGLAPGDPIIAGPTSKSPLLRQLAE
jgi:hypothetical protein